jgi:hypothetical protein
MHKLDTTKPDTIGQITPPWQPKDFDRPAHFQQRGRFFDNHGIEIVSGQAGPGENDEPVVVEKKIAEPAPISPIDLIAAVGSMPWPKFHKEAKRILGKDCPAGKPAIVDALKTAIEAYEARRRKRDTTHKGISWDGVTEGKETARAQAEAEALPPEEPVQKPAKTNGKVAVDLRAWGCGTKEYLSAEVIKAVREKYYKQIGVGEHWRRDVVDLLLEEKVITAAQARRDI